MRIATKPWLLLPAVAAAVFGAAFLLQNRPHPAPVLDTDLPRLLPAGAKAVFFADLATLRAAGALKILNPSNDDPDYASFVAETHFDYTRDIDALAGSVDAHSVFIAARGRFDWTALRHYAISRGGTCSTNYCRLRATEPGRWICLWSLRQNILELSVGPTYEPKPAAPKNPVAAFPVAPVWIKFSPLLLQETGALPALSRWIPALLRPAGSVIISLQPSPQPEDAFEIRLDALCDSPAAAEALANQLALETKLLRLGQARSPNTTTPGLADLLTSGEFHSNGTHAVGTWPVPKALVQALE